MNAFVLFAFEFGDVIQWAGAAVFILLWALGPILKGIAERNAKVAGDAKRANKAAARRAGQAGGAPNPEAEVERFLREVTRNRADGGASGEPTSVRAEIVLGEDDLLLSEPMPSKRVPAKEKQPPRQVAASDNSIESRHLAGGLRDRPERHSDVEYADEKVANRVHSVFDHKLGQLGATTGSHTALTPATDSGATDSRESGAPIVLGTAIPTTSAHVADMLRDPATVRQAILIHEILGAPRCDSTDVGQSGVGHSGTGQSG